MTQRASHKPVYEVVKVARQQEIAQRSATLHTVAPAIMEEQNAATPIIDLTPIEKLTAEVAALHTRITKDAKNAKRRAKGTATA